MFQATWSNSNPLTALIFSPRFMPMTEMYNLWAYYLDIKIQCNIHQTNFMPMKYLCSLLLEVLPQTHQPTM